MKKRTQIKIRIGHDFLWRRDNHQYWIWINPSIGTIQQNKFYLVYLKSMYLYCIFSYYELDSKINNRLFVLLFFLIKNNYKKVDNKNKPNGTLTRINQQQWQQQQYQQYYLKCILKRLKSIWSRFRN